MNLFEYNEQLAIALKLAAPAITADFRSSVRGSGLARKSGRSAREFNSKVMRDRSDGEVWGLSFGTTRYVYMHHHGMESKDVSRLGYRYRHPGYTKRGMLIGPAERGAVLIGNVIVPISADYFVKGIRF